MKIHLADLIPILDRRLRHRLGFQDAGAIDQDVEPTLIVHDAVHYPLKGLGMGDIQLKMGNGQILGWAVFEIVRVDVGNMDCHTFACQCTGNFLANSI